MNNDISYSITHSRERFFSAGGFSMRSVRLVVIAVVLAILPTLLYHNYSMNSSLDKNQTYALGFEQSFTATIDKFSYLVSLYSDDIRTRQLLNKTIVHNEFSFELAKKSRLEGIDAFYLMNRDGLVVASSDFQTDRSFYGGKL